ncbi:MAG: YdiU family protein [Acidimicrobiales bacterium]|nr:YdiU family protein [Acidimicrobiales bacterium]RZV43396.1 MAG: YdiU family protein [Acidimicrobiales bacterium]
MTATLSALSFDNRYTRELPGDANESSQSRQVPRVAWSPAAPAATASPRLVSVAAEVAELLGLTEEQIASDEFRDMATGNLVLPGMRPFAMRYGGHQFGNWAGQLGDGRAINLGEMVTPDGSRQTLQLKGAGRTPYSRSADGLAVLRSSIREYLCSEAMFHLGVPTTRALSLALTGDQVMRDMLYDGHPELEPGAIVCRVAPTFIRFGNFELFAAMGELDELGTLADFTIREYFPELWPGDGAPTPDTYVAFFKEVVHRTADMLVEWQRVGFVHGVMNTDNLSILGLTIDYGPYGWLEDYDPDWTPNTTDRNGKRYRFGNQPGIGQWNLAQLGNALYPLIEDAEPLQTAIDGYVTRFRAGYQRMFAGKLGLVEWDTERDEPLMVDLLALLTDAETDMTLFFRGLAEVPIDGSADDRFEPLRNSFYVPDQVTAVVRDAWDEWLARYAERVQADGTSDAERKAAMNAVNPIYVMRNYLAQLAIDQATDGDFTGVNELLDVMRNPYTEQPGREQYAEKRPDWARTRVGCSMLSCSS